jgi:DNA-binding HxlR family transcriptional regulator
MQELSLESDFRRTHKNLEIRYLNFSFVDCPVQECIGILGKKWTILIVRDIAIYGRSRFNELIKSLPRIPPKVLADRLRQLEKEGFIKKDIQKSVPPKVVRWSLTEKGMDVFPIVMIFAGFGCKWNADRVFEDKKPRKMHEILDPEGMKLLMKDF